VQQLYIWSALPFAAGAIVTFLVHALLQKRLRERPELQKAL
jgi:heme exporter protein D